MAILTPTYQDETVATYKISALAASAKTDLIKVRGARSVFLIASVNSAVQIKIPTVPATGNPDNTAGARAASLITTSVSNSIVDPGDAAIGNGGRCGAIPGDMMPALIYLENVSAGTVDIDVWVTF